MKKQVVLVISMVVLVNSGLLQANSADINNNGAVDSNDLTIFVAAWLSDDTPTPNWNSACDISNPNDGFIDGLDFGVLSANWLWLWESTLDPAQFAFIPAGTFEMGDHHDSMSYALPVHTVTLDSFYISKYEITHQQYCDYLNTAYPAQIKVFFSDVYAADDTGNSYPYCKITSPSYHQINFSDPNFTVNIKDGTIDMSDHPMVYVSWYGAAVYCNWRSQQEGLESCYNLSTWDCDFTKNGYRLPTEAEWEYTARGGKHSPYYRYPWGNTIDGSMANYRDSGDPYQTALGPWTTPVGYYDGGQTPIGVDMANGYGLYDMAGNVFEWCNDWYGGSYSSNHETNPIGPASGSSRVARGGCWYYFNYQGACRVADRSRMGNPDICSGYFGFRVCVFASH